MAFPAFGVVPPVTLADWQFCYQNLVMGANTPFGMLKIEGLSQATIRQGDQSFPRDHGQFIGLDLYDGRDVTVDFWVVSDGTSLQSSQLALAAATGVSPNQELPLWFQLPNLPLLCVMARPRGRPLDLDTDYAAADVAKPTVTWHCTDPRIYTVSDMFTIVAEDYYNGLGPYPVGPFPVTFPYGLPSGEVELTNTGNTEMRPQLILTAPASSESPVIAIANASISSTPTLTFSLTDFVAPAQLFVDLATPHRVLLYPDGIAAGTNTPSMLSLQSGSVWWDMLPGVNKIAFSSTLETVATTVTVLWAGAYEL